MSAATLAVMSLLALIAAAAILLPLRRGPREEASRREHDLSVYRDQLDEVERELASGRIGADQAAAARAEIERRILRIVDASERGETLAAERPIPRVAAWALAVAVPLTATVVYLEIGSPGMPDVPHASRAVADPAAVAERQEFERLTNRLAERLQQGEGDLAGWIMLARSLRTLGRDQESAEAYGRAVEMTGGLDRAPPALLEDFGEAQFAASGGQVTPEARQTFDAALRREPRSFKARHYLAVAHLQSGQPERAIAIWRGMERDSPPEAPWLPELRHRIGALAAEIGVDAQTIEPDGASGPAVAAEAADHPAAPPGPTAAEMEAAADMSAEERAAFIERMVERLANRLQEAPEDAEGWARLARAYTVLGETEKATEARGRAVAQFRQKLEALPPDSPERPGIEARLSELEAQG